MWKFVERLSAPELVVNVQEFFGIKYLNIEDNDREEQDAQTIEGTMHKRHLSYGSSETDEGFNEPSGSSSSGGGNGSSRAEFEDEREVANRDAIKPVEVRNRFWYYLFVIGTELGDEIFYATMMPFWFWNIDGAVGRRVVFVWAIVMYIGIKLKNNCFVKINNPYFTCAFQVNLPKKSFGGQGQDDQCIGFKRSGALNMACLQHMPW